MRRFCYFQPQISEPSATCTSPTPRGASTCSSPAPRGFTPTPAHLSRRAYTPVSTSHIAVSRGVTPTLVSTALGHLSPTFLSDARSTASQRPSTLSPTPTVSCSTSGKTTPDPLSGLTPVLGRKEARYRFSLIVVSVRRLTPDLTLTSASGCPCSPT